ncbi:hypothetical protein ACSQ67_021332 [Phaseolus vulgaris]
MMQSLPDLNHVFSFLIYKERHFGVLVDDPRTLVYFPSSTRGRGGSGVRSRPSSTSDKGRGHVRSSKVCVHCDPCHTTKTCYEKHECSPHMQISHSVCNVQSLKDIDEGDDTTSFFLGRSFFYSNYNSNFIATSGLNSSFATIKYGLQQSNLDDMAGGDNGRRHVSGDETKNKTGKSRRGRRKKWVVKNMLAWAWRKITLKNMKKDADAAAASATK